jgi:hypothetical protein
VVTEIVGRQPIDTAEYRHSGFQVHCSVQPRLKGIGSRERQVVANIHSQHIRLKATSGQGGSAGAPAPEIGLRAQQTVFRVNLRQNPILQLNPRVVMADVS